MRLYAITDRPQLQTPLLERVALLLHAGVDYLQIREEDLNGKPPMFNLDGKCNDALVEQVEL